MSVKSLTMSAAGYEPPLAIEDVFSTYLYTGTGAAQTINNGIDLAGKGGLIWTKFRSGSFGTEQHALMDTLRGANNWIDTGTTGAQLTYANMLNSFNANGYTLGSDNVGGKVNWLAQNYASWTFRKAPKFFDVVTYTGNGVSGRTISHSLGQAPGMIIVKCTSVSDVWLVYHNSQPNTYGRLDSTAAFSSSFPQNKFGNGTTVVAPTSTSFTVAGDSDINGGGRTYVAYLFAHDTTTDGLIQCGSFTTDGLSGAAAVTLGYEPQYVLYKPVTNTGNWRVMDNMRGWNAVGSNIPYLDANTASAEATDGSTNFPIKLNNTGFSVSGLVASTTYIYMAIRRGPMRTPTDGTKVFSPVARTGTGANATVSPGFITDTVIEGNRTSTTAGTKFGTWDRLRNQSYLITNTTAAEVAAATTIIQANPWDVMDGYKVGTTSALTNASSSTFINWMFKRAPGFFDVVCYTGTGAARTVNHNLGVAPELMIVKSRSNIDGWICYNASLGPNYWIGLDSNSAAVNQPAFVTTPTNTVFTVGAGGYSVNETNNTYVAYLFASCPGVSKIGSYTGNGSSQTINCGFTNGARFFLVKATSTTGNWWVYDTARGVVAAADPTLALNTTAAEVTSADAVDPDSTGIIVNQEATCSINANGVSYIYLAIA